MAGLPKSYIKKYGVSKRAWREYRKSKRKGRRMSSTAKPKRKTRTRTIVVRKSAPRRAVKMSGTRRRRAVAVSRNILGTTTKTLVGTAVGVGGAVGSAAAINVLPMDTRAKALIQMGVGALAMAMLPRKMRNLRIAAGGASLAGALAVIKSTGAPLPLLAGSNSMGINYYPTMGRRALPAVPPKAPAGKAVMGANLHKTVMSGMAARNGYGKKFITQANM